MRYRNPVLSGFYPDPSVCRAGDSFYLVCSSFQYFPGVPLFESRDLVNWRQIGHVLTRKSQVQLSGVRSSGGVFAPTIRYHDGRFYMVTNNNSTNENFYVYTDDIYGEWSEPVVVEQDGIDPSLLFDGGHVYFQSNGTGVDGRGVVQQCEIDIESGRKLTESETIWAGSGGRYLESPHVYHIGEWYYLMVAEGGTEYGHMITMARSKTVWGPFEACPHNPILSNRDKAPFSIQGVGHGDLVQGTDGSWHIVCLGFRQIGKWEAYHHLGRETFLAPARLRDDGWFAAGTDGTMEYEYDIDMPGEQLVKTEYSFENTQWGREWIYLRFPDENKYEFFEDAAGAKSLGLRGSDVSLNEAASPTFIGIRQMHFDIKLSCRIVPDKDGDTPAEGEAGISVYMDEAQHYDLALSYTEAGELRVQLMITMGGLSHCEKSIVLPARAKGAGLLIEADAHNYRFMADCGERLLLGTAPTRGLSTEFAGGFTGVVLGLYACGDIYARFSDFRYIAQAYTGEE